ncbi:MAG: YHS domain-containing protein [Candidatus Marsarchaeota archaeon]|jgi:Cu+-exporting ATPase|nr:YHS domain-containing protein [Candidatus Marsarchaeota archaeon]
MAKDVVCGMSVDEKSALSLVYNGRKYYFCSKACKEKFEKDSEKYSASA